MTIHREDALMAGEIALEADARSYEETAEKIEDRDWEEARYFYHIAGRERLKARKLHEMYH